MDVTWFGGSCFRLQSGNVSILTDPFDLPWPTTNLSADVVTVSRRDARERLAVRPPYRLVDGPGEYEIKGVPVTGIAMPVQDDGAPPWRNFAYTVLVDGVLVCHLGRITRPPTAQEIQDLGSPDVLLVPLGEPQGLAVPQAVALVSQLESKLLVPMSLGGPEDRTAVERFCRELGADPGNFEPRLTVTSGGLPATTRVALLVPQAPA